MEPTDFGQEAGSPSGYSQSQETFDDIWRDLAEESGGGEEENGGDGGGGGWGSGLNQLQGQRTMGEMTLEEFFMRAGVVKEENQFPVVKEEDQFLVEPDNTGFFGDLSRSGSDTSVAFEFQEENWNMGMMGNRIPDQVNNQTATQSARILPSNGNGDGNGVRSTSTQPSGQGIMGGIVGITEPWSINGNLIQDGGMGMVGLWAGAVFVAKDSPASDGLGKSNGDTSYVFNGGLRVRKCRNGVEKVVESRKRRMIKNRESAARSRARKQAYTTDLETANAKLKEENEELRQEAAGLGDDEHAEGR